jgi:protein-L-isoaspartate(D-aspartate) O-methyltransferase
METTPPMPPDTDWHQYRIEFTDPATVMPIAAQHLAPTLTQAQRTSQLSTWWYIRKPPGLRLRYRPTDPHTQIVDTLLSDLAATGHLTSWTRGTYEPETVAFGGPAAMTIAHTLFHHDSRHLLVRAAPPNTTPVMGQRETTVLLFATMLRAAGLDWFEQGDVWAMIVDLRPATPACRTTAELDRAIQRLMTVNPRSVPDLLAQSWLAAFETAGQQLATLDRQGQLNRGLRAVLAHHFIFHANRAGLPAADQATLANLAANAVFTPPDRPASAGTIPNTSKVPQ